MPEQPLPRDVLGGIAWSFAEGEFDDPAAFSEAVRNYQIDIAGDDTWKPEDVVLPVPKVLIDYRCGGGSKTVELTSPNGQAWTALALLFAMHRAIAPDVAERDHHFFEGLQLNSAPPGGSPPLYVLRLGS